MYDFKKSFKLAKINLNPWPEGKKGLAVRTHREMVGGLWEQVGTLQFEYIKSQGLKPQDNMLDIGCGCLRGGRHFIRYLDKGKYYGIDKQTELLEAGKNEIGAEVLVNKQPVLVQSDSFDFSVVVSPPRFAVAQSVFTHLNPSDIILCLRNLRDVSDADTQFFCTFFEAEKKVLNMFNSHSSRKFDYTINQMEGFAKKSGWKMEYVGDWGHPREQMMTRYYL